MGYHFTPTKMAVIKMRDNSKNLWDCSSPGGSDGKKKSSWNAGDLGLIPRWGRSPGEGNGNPLQYSCLENPMDGEAQWATQRVGHD